MRKIALFLATVTFFLSTLCFARDSDAALVTPDAQTGGSSTIASSRSDTGVGLSGVVTDHSGAALRYVAVTIRNVDTGATRTIATDRGGHYQAAGLPLGRFEIRAAKEGFADETRTGISLAAGQDATVDITMQRTTPDVCASGHEFLTTDCSRRRRIRSHAS